MLLSVLCLAMVAMKEDSETSYGATATALNLDECGLDYYSDQEHIPAEY